MASVDDAVKALQDYTAIFQTTEDVYRGILGNGDGLVEVPGRAGYVYVRNRANPEATAVEAEEVIHCEGTVPLIEGYPVLYGMAVSGRKEILSRDYDFLSDWVFNDYLRSHHEQHQFPGHDTVWVQKQQINPFLVYPSSPTDWTVSVHEDYYAYEDSTVWFEGATSKDFEEDKPPYAGQGRYMTIYLDCSTNSLAYLTGDIFTILLPPSDRDDMIETPPEGSIPLAAIYIQGDQTSISWDEIYDIRLLITPMGGTATPGSHGILNDTYHTGVAADISADRGELLAIDASGDVYALTAGAADQILAMDDSGNDPTWRDFAQARQIMWYIPTAPLVTGNNSSAVVVYRGEDFTADGWDLQVKVAPTGQDLIMDVNLGGTSLWNVTPADRPTVSAGATSGSGSSFDTTTISDGDVLTVDIDQVGSGAAGSQATLILEGTVNVTPS